MITCDIHHAFCSKMSPPLITSTHFHKSFHDVQNPDTFKMHHHQQQHPYKYQPRQPITCALVDKSTRLIKGAYDLILLNLVVPLLSLIYFKHSTSPIFTTSHHSTAAVANTTPFSALIGQLFFRYLGDAYGRRKFYSLNLMIIIFGTLFCALPSTGGGIDEGGGGKAMIQYLTFWRFVLTFGIGGDYPISATVSSEQAAVTSRRRRGGQLITILTSIQGLGNLMASIVTLMVLIRFRVMIVSDDGDDDDNGTKNMDMVWRICIAVGCLPALSTALIRYTMPATAPGSGYRTDADPQNCSGDTLRPSDLIDEDGVENNKSSSISNSSFPLLAAAHTDSTPSPSTPSSPSKSPHSRRVHATRVFRDYCSQWKNLKVLIGTSLSWFLLDLAFRSIALNQSYLLDALDSSAQNSNNTTGSNNKTRLYRHLWMTTLGNLIISLLGIVPGYWFAIFSIEKMHHKRAQFLGFAVMLSFFTLLSTAFHHLKAIVPLFITTFTVSQFFANLSKSTPYVVPGEVFPTRVRATAHGVSAGSGKVGAVLAMVMFNRLVEMESPLSETSLLSSGRSTTTVRIVLGMGMVMTVGVLAVAFIFPRGTRRLLSSKRVWSRRSKNNSIGVSGTGSRAPHQSFEINV